MQYLTGWDRDYSGKIFLDGQLWVSVRILPSEEIKNFLEVVNHYAVNFDNLEGYQATLSGAK